MANLRIEPCECGRTPKVHAERVAEDAMETFVVCACGLMGDEVEDAYSDPDTAIWNWNKGVRRRPATQPTGQAGEGKDRG